MRTAMPWITDHADERKQRLQPDHQGHTKPRLQMLYLLASRQAQTRQPVARLLGVHRNTSGRWLARYAAGGLDALLQTDVPAGQPVARAPEVLARREPALRRPEGFASDEAVRPWGARPHGVPVQ